MAGICNTTRKQLSIDFVHRFFTFFSWISIVWLIKFNHKYMHNHLRPNISKYKRREKNTFSWKVKLCEIYVQFHLDSCTVVTSQIVAECHLWEQHCASFFLFFSQTSGEGPHHADPVWEESWLLEAAVAGHREKRHRRPDRRCQESPALQVPGSCKFNPKRSGLFCLSQVRAPPPPLPRISAAEWQKILKFGTYVE